MKKLRIGLYGALLAVLLSANAFAAKIENVKITGNKRVEDTTVRSYLGFLESKEYAPDLADKAIKSLYATGLFDNVNVAWDGSTVTVTVSENPLVNKVVFEGNEEIVAERLNDIVSLKTRGIYTVGKVQSDVRNIQAVYRQSGRFLTTVEPKIIRRDQNRVDVIYEINEGEKTRISSIKFVGNKRFADGDLQEVVHLRESRWWRFLSTSDVYDPDRLELDKELLRRHYIRHGYADFKVISGVAELSRDKTSFFITYTLSEGPVYKFGNVAVNLQADEEGLNEADLLKEVAIKKGELYNGERVETNADNLTDYLGDYGFAFLDVKPELGRDEAERVINLTYNVNPGPRVYVNRINIKGNDRTREHVVRREMRFVEGDAFSSSKLQRSRDRLTYLGYFKDVAITPIETEFPDRLDLDVALDEQSTGEFNIGAGFSTYEGFLATADVRERNFLGKGQDVKVAFSLSQRRQDYSLAFTEPYFMGRELGAGVDLFNNETDFQDESSYDVANLGAGLRLRFPLDEFTRNTISLKFTNTEIKNVSAGASSFVNNDLGEKTSIALGNTFTIDSRDSYTTPTHGSRFSVETEYAGLGGDIDYLKAIVSYSKHFQIKEGWVLSAGARAGAIWDMDKQLPIYDHLTAGGTTLRGFETRGIGPRDATTDDALGGKYLIGNNVELTFPLPGVKDIGLNGLFFFDGGLVTEFDSEDQSNITDSSIYRMSVGAGIYWRSPMGPLRFEFGFPIQKAEEDITKVFSFSVGTRF